MHSVVCLHNHNNVASHVAASIDKSRIQPHSGVLQTQSLSSLVRVTNVASSRLTLCSRTGGRGAGVGEVAVSQCLCCVKIANMPNLHRYKMQKSSQPTFLAKQIGHFSCDRVGMLKLCCLVWKWSTEWIVNWILTQTNQFIPASRAEQGWKRNCGIF